MLYLWEPPNKRRTNWEDLFPFGGTGIRLWRRNTEKMPMSGSSRWFASCAFPLGTCGICVKKKDIDLHELFIIKKEDDVIQKKKYLSRKSRLKQHCHICSHWMHIFSAWVILFFVKTFCIIFIITCNLNQMYYTLPGLHFSYFWEKPLEPKNNILCKVKLPYTIYNGLQSCILQVYIFS